MLLFQEFLVFISAIGMYNKMEKRNKGLTNVIHVYIIFKSENLCSHMGTITATNVIRISNFK